METGQQAYVDIECFLTNELPVKLAVNSVQDLLPAEEKAGLGVWKADLANLTEKSIICWDNLCGKRRGILIERNSVSEFISLLSDHNFSQLKQNATANWRSIQKFLSRSCWKKVWIFWLYKPKCLRRKVLSYLLYLKALIVCAGSISKLSSLPNAVIVKWCQSYNKGKLEKSTQDIYKSC